MAGDARKPRPGPKRDTYGYQTLRPINWLVFLLPLLAFFQWGMMTYGTELLVPRYLQGFLRFFGGGAAWLPGVFIVVVLLAQQAAHKDGWAVQPTAVAGMAGESIFWTFPLIALNLVTGYAAAPKAAASWLSPQASDAVQKGLYAVGAGIYEEFVFRLILISLLMLIFVDILGLRRDAVAIGAVLVSALLFALCHFTYPELAGNAHFDRGRFIFFVTAGVYWGGLFVFRGLAVAAGSHILWDLYALLASDNA